MRRIAIISYPRVIFSLDNVSDREKLLAIEHNPYVFSEFKETSEDVDIFAVRSYIFNIGYIKNYTVPVLNTAFARIEEYNREATINYKYLIDETKLPEEFRLRWEML